MLLEALALVVVLLILFLGNLRAALVVSLSLPLAVLATFGVMRLWGLSANIMSLGGLAIAIGLLVDCAVVVVENVAHRLAHAHGRHTDLPARLRMTAEAVREVAVPLVSGVIIIVTVTVITITSQRRHIHNHRPSSSITLHVDLYPCPFLFDSISECQ